MNLVQKIKGFSRYEIDMTDFSDVKVFSLNYHNTGCRQQLTPYNNSNHLNVCLTNDEGKQKNMTIHKLVWRQFNGEIPKGFDIHHINFNPSDNRPENLVLLSCSEHRKLHSKFRNEDGNFGAMKKKCLQFDKEWNLIKEWESGREIQREIGHSARMALARSNSYKTAYGFIWIYKSKYEQLISENKWEEFKKNYFKDRRTPVVALDKNGNFVAEYKSIIEASRVTGIAQSSICKCCQHKKGFNSTGGFIWIYKDEYTAQTQHDQ